MSGSDHWDSMYARPLEEVPWEIETVPGDLSKLIESGTITPGRALDVGCGTGNYSIYLAEHGFDVTGIDFSEKALIVAGRRAADRGLTINFLQGDATRLTTIFSQPFDFILEYSLLHHISPVDLSAYTAQFPALLAPGGKLLVVCYSEKDEDAAGQNVRMGKYGNAMYYRTADEIRQAHSGLRELFYSETRLGKRLQHAGHCFLFEKTAGPA